MQCPNATLLAPVVPESPAHHCDTALQRGIADKTLRPEVGEEFLTGYHPVRVGQEIGEHLENLVVEGDQASRPTQFIAARIERTVLKHVEHRPLLGRSASRAGAARSTALDRQRLVSQPPTRPGSPEDVTGCHLPGSPFYNKYISSVSAKYQLFIRSLLRGGCIFFVVSASSSNLFGHGQEAQRSIPKQQTNEPEGYHGRAAHYHYTGHGYRAQDNSHRGLQE